MAVLYANKNEIVNNNINHNKRPSGTEEWT